MTKYNSKLKTQIVHEYLSTSQSIYDLGERYDIRPRLIAQWVQRYRMEGLNLLKPRRHKRTFTANFKLNMIDYYQTHEESMAEVAARFEVLTCQISIWRSQSKRGGIKALEPHPKGRQSKVKRTKKQLRKLANKTEAERLKEELAKKNQELYDTKLERDILKKSLTLFGPSKQNRKPK